MKTAKYIIIDIETLGRRNDAAITQVGIIPTDENFNALDQYLIQVDSNVWNTCNRTFTGETLLWWTQQKNTPVSKFPTQIANSYKDLVKKLNYIFSRYTTEDSIVWTKGTMDLFCIKDLYEYFDMDIPWKFWQPRDIRTAKELIKEWKVIKSKSANIILHDALNDAFIELEELKINLSKK